MRGRRFLMTLVLLLLLSGLASLALEEQAVILGASGPSHRWIAYEDDLGMIIQRSDLILHGRIEAVGDSWNLSRDPQNYDLEAKDHIGPGTDFLVRPLAYLRGGDQGELLTITISGGSYKGVSEPLWADVEVGEAYLFFLASHRIAGKQVHAVITNPGIFRLEDGKVTVLNASDPTAADFPPIQLEELQQMLLRLPRRDPDPAEQPSPSPGAQLPGHKELKGGY